jgi:hypothetical protein
MSNQPELAAGEEVGLGGLRRIIELTEGVLENVTNHGVLIEVDELWGFTIPRTAIRVRIDRAPKEVPYAREANT